MGWNGKAVSVIDSVVEEMVRSCVGSVFSHCGLHD